VNLFPDRLEVVNPGRLPMGVTPHNILHASRRRNEGLARVFHDLNLMEREGSGFDLAYDHLKAHWKEMGGIPEQEALELMENVRHAVEAFSAFMDELSERAGFDHCPPKHSRP